MEKEAQRHLTILNEIAEGKHITQRAIADKLGVALGLVNLYLKRLVRKGYIKVSTIPSNRIKYLLTPNGIAEKARLTYEYMDYSLYLFRETRNTLREGLESLVDQGIRRVAIYGTSEAAELAFLTLRDLGLEVPVIISGDGYKGTFLGLPVLSLAEISGEELDLIIVASFTKEVKDIADITNQGFPRERILTLYH
ncbi:MAG: winged helix-turn-helix transcriptional regulator [Pseudomonadota bacterium]